MKNPNNSTKSHIGEAAVLRIDRLMEENQRLREREATLVRELLWINDDVWPLVHMLTSRETVRARFRRLPDIISPKVKQ